MPFPGGLRALNHADFRRFFLAQLIALVCGWMHTVAQSWLVLQLTDSPLRLGLIGTLQFGPILLFSIFTGAVADRVPKRRLLMATQATLAVLALVLAALVVSRSVRYWHVAVVAVLAGLAQAFDGPARQSFMAEMVGKADVVNAVALNSASFNAARIVGPALAGVLISAVGIAACFYANAASYLAVVTGLLLMRLGPRAEPKLTRTLDAMREGFGYMFGNRWPRALVTIIATFAVFGFSFITMMPVFARDVLHLEAGGYGALVSAVGVGAAAAALGAAAFGRRLGGAGIGRTWVLFGVLLAAGAFAPTFVSALVIFTLTGCTMALNSILANTQLQIQAPDELRGRVMGFYSFVVLGMAPFGSLQAGWVAEHLGVRAAFGLGGAVCLLAAAVVGRKGRKDGRTEGRVEALAPAPAAEPEPTPVAARTVSVVPEQGPTPGE